MSAQLIAGDTHPKPVLRVWTAAENPALIPQIALMEQSWAPFMNGAPDPVGRVYYRVAAEVFPDNVLMFEDVARPGTLGALAFSIPFYSPHGPVPDDKDLPEDGWDGVIRLGLGDRLTGTVPNMVSGLETTIRPDLQGHGLALPILRAFRSHFRRMGAPELIIPVRPSIKHRPGYAPDRFDQYVREVREDGLPVDPWLRVQVRAGGRIAHTIPRSMVITAPLHDWRAWSGKSLTEPGSEYVNGAISNIYVDPARDIGVYVEPNVWVRHDLTAEDPR